MPSSRQQERRVDNERILLPQSVYSSEEEDHEPGKPGSFIVPHSPECGVSISD